MVKGYAEDMRKFKKQSKEITCKGESGSLPEDRPMDNLPFTTEYNN